MKISTSILSISDNLKTNIEKLDKCNTDYLHLDIMDGKFVSNKTWSSQELSEYLVNTTKPRDVHLMVYDIKKYVDDFIKLNPVFITFHVEATTDVIEMINYIKSKNINVGISIKPSTSVQQIYKYLNLVDLVLVMSVEPGRGGQSFIPSSTDKINQLYQYRADNNLDYVIEVDGGINDKTIDAVKNTDIAVVGSFITKNNYEESINILKH